MRASVVLVILACAAAALDAGAAPKPRRDAPIRSAPAGFEEPTASAVVVLKTPGPDAIRFPSGTFTMGSSEAEIAHAQMICQRAQHDEDCRSDWFADEYAPHDVYLDAFWLDRTETTVAAYRRCVEAGACAEPPYSLGAARFDHDDYPVVLVTWTDAQKYCAWAGGRLPTEAEWERAARGRTGRRYPWGNVYNPNLANHGRSSWSDLDPIDTYDDGDGFLELAPVGSFPDGATPEGIVDLAGNVEEWVGDYYAREYPKADAANPKGPDTGDYRVVRGGAYGGMGKPMADDNRLLLMPLGARPWLRATARSFDLPSSRATWRGFRCARPE